MKRASFFLLLGVLMTPAYAQISVSLPPVTAAAGQTGSIPVITSDLSGTGVFSFDFTLTYDASVLSLDGVSVDGTVADGCNLQSNATAPGVLVVSAACSSERSGSGDLVRLSASYLAAGSSALTWSSFAFNEGSPAASPGPGNVTVTEAVSIFVTLPNIEGIAGQTGSIPVSTSDLSGTGVFSFDFTVSFDPDVVQLTGVSGGGGTAQACSIQSNSGVAGQIRVSAGCSAELSGPGPMVFLEASFVSEGSSTLQWSTMAFNEGSPSAGLTNGSVTVTAVSVTATDDIAVTQEDVAVTVDVLSNDFGTLPLDPASVSVTTIPSVGSAERDPISGRITYTPETDYYGSVTFAYRVSDGEGNVSNIAQVTITVVSVNDLPTVAVNQPLSVGFGESGTISSDLLASLDPDHVASSLAYVISAAPAKGSILRGSILLGGGDSFLQAEVDGGLISYRHDGVESGVDELGFDLTDPAGDSSAGAFAIQIGEQPIPLIVSVSSSNPPAGVSVSVGTQDSEGLADGVTPFTRRYHAPASSITLEAPESAEGNPFARWFCEVDGSASAQFNTSEITVDLVDGLHCKVAYLAAPSSGSAVVDSQGLRHFNWNAVLGASAYRLQVADRPFFDPGMRVIVDIDTLTSGSFVTTDALIPAGTNHYWRVQSGVSRGSGMLWSAWLENLVIGTSAQEAETPPEAMELHAFPNPATSAASLRYVLSRPGEVRLRVIDVTGREVHIIATGQRASGSFDTHLTVQSWPSGVYFLVMEMDTSVITKQFLVVH
jgi:Cadherin-like/Bacterial Ig domain/Cohesin domain/Secretion system C-terminal sorting domain